MKFIDTDKSDLQNCPAAVDMETGDVYINRDVWDDYTESEKQFIIQHEIGHYEQQTDSETLSDQYALKQNFGKVKKSLKSSFTALDKAGVKDDERYTELYREALAIDAENGNPVAAIELNNIKSVNKPKNQEKMKNRPTQITYITGNTPKNKQRVTRRNFCRADGNSTESSNSQSHSHKKNGIVVSDHYFSYTNILLFAIALILIIKLKK